MRRAAANEVRPEELTLKQFFSRLQVGQAWALLGICAGLLAGAFVLGYKVDALVADAKLAEKDVQLTASRAAAEQATANLQKASTETGDAQTKEIFLSLYLRYLLAQQQPDAAERASTREAFDEFIRQHVNAKALIIHKGGGHLATIKFSDGTVWEIPKELHAVARQ